jgi:sec-independent protein translocase protein TatB
VFNVGGGELIVIALIALIVLGPQRLPDAARQVGKVMGDLRKLSTGFQNEMKSAFVEADDPTRISARRNVLAKEAPVEAAADAPTEPADVDVDVDPAVAAAVDAVAAPHEPPPSAKVTPPAGSKTTSATEQANPRPSEAEGDAAEGAAAEASSDPVVPGAEPPRSTP